MNTAPRHDPFPVAAPYAGIYAHGVETPRGARFVHVSGQVGVSPQGELRADFDGQCRQAIANVRAVLEQAGMTLANVVKMSFFLVRREDMAGLVAVRQELLDGVRPAVTTVLVAGLLHPDWLVEIEALAYAD